MSICLFQCCPENLKDRIHKELEMGIKYHTVMFHLVVEGTIMLYLWQVRRMKTVIKQIL